MQLEFGEKKSHGSRKVQGKRQVILTDRDFEILKFILEMKFASVSEVFEKFFRLTKLNHEAKSSEWTRKRLYQLQGAGFLNAQRSFSEETRYFTITPKGYGTLKNRLPELELVRPFGGFDQRTFCHDKMVLRSRLDFEDQQGISEWISDRQLRMGKEIQFGLSSQYVPDAVYRLPSGERVAFELEIATKAKSRYQEKIRRYVDIIRKRRDDPSMFKKVHFVCLRKAPFEIIKSETKIYGELFKVELQGEVAS